jgi:glycine C-acetyltransferase
VNDGTPSAESASLNLADFFIGASKDPLTPPAGFAEWRRAMAWAAALYEPKLLGAPEPRTRVMVEGREHAVINLASYNYLGLARHPEVVAAITDAVAHYGSGACGSPMLSGKSDLHDELERRLSAFLGREATMLFNSGFGGAMGCLAGLLRRGDAVFADAAAHVSMADGAQLSHAKVETFPHNDLRALEAALARSPAQRRLLVVEGIYSMDGDTADLPAVCALAEQYRSSVLVDEAHSTLTCGIRGRGMVEAQAVEDRVGLYFGTFSKAFAGIGGFVSGRAETIDYLRCFAHGYGFSCALPPATVAGLLAALTVAEREPERRHQLAENAVYFRTRLRALGLDFGESTSHVVPIILGGSPVRLYRLGHALLRRGLFLAPIDYPAVAHDRIRFRAAITAAHTRADLDEALEIIRDVIVPELSET